MVVVIAAVYTDIRMFEVGSVAGISAKSPVAIDVLRCGDCSSCLCVIDGAR